MRLGREQAVGVIDERADGRSTPDDERTTSDAVNRAPREENRDRGLEHPGPSEEEERVGTR